MKTLREFAANPGSAWKTACLDLKKPTVIRWMVKGLSCLLFGKVSLFIISILTLEFLFLFFAQPAQCAPANTALCLFRREIDGQGPPRNNEVTLARLAEQQVKNLEEDGLSSENFVADTDVRAFMLDHIQSLKNLLQGFAKKGDLPDPELFSEIVGFMAPTSMNSIITTFFLRLQLKRGEDFSGPLNYIFREIQSRKGPDLLPSLKEKTDLLSLLLGVQVLSNRFLILVNVVVTDLEQGLSGLRIQIPRENNSLEERTRAVFQLLVNLRQDQAEAGRIENICRIDEIFPSAAFKAVFSKKLSQQGWDLLAHYTGGLFKKLPMTPDVTCKEIDITSLDSIKEYLGE